VEAFETYREWAPENWSPDGNPGEREARLASSPPRDNGRARAFYRREGWCETGDERYAPHIDLQIVEYRRSLDP
jgi:hypothetical protein